MEQEDRVGGITYIAESESELYADTSNEEYRELRRETSEIEALRELDIFLAAVMEHGPEEYVQKAQAIRENLTFIGEKEYSEATAGLASYWKAELDDSPDLHILVVVGEIATKGGRLDKVNPPIKSDEYLLENILGNFSDDELEVYAERLHVSADSVPQDARGSNLKVILLDDWTISGSQLEDAYIGITRRYPEFAESIEVQLIVANQRRLTEGFEAYAQVGTTQQVTLRAYYEAHHSEYPGYSNSDAHTTGYLSSVDFDFAEEIATMVEVMNELGHKMAMPALTTIVRPYRSDGYTRENLVWRNKMLELGVMSRKEEVPV